MSARKKSTPSLPPISKNPDAASELETKATIKANADTVLTPELESLRPVTQRLVQEGRNLKTQCNELAAPLISSVETWLNSIRGVEFDHAELIKISQATRNLIYCLGMHLTFNGTPVGFSVGGVNKQFGSVYLAQLGPEAGQHIYSQAAIPPFGVCVKTAANASTLNRPPEYPSASSYPLTAQFISDGRELRARLHRLQNEQRITTRLHRWLESIVGIKFPIPEGDVVANAIRVNVQAAGRILTHNSEAVSLSVGPKSSHAKSVTFRLYRKSKKDRQAYGGVRMPEVSTARP